MVAVDTEAAVQVATLVLAVLAIVWHQQRSTDKLRDDFNRSIDKLRDEFGRSIDKLRDDVGRSTDKLRDDFTGLRGEVAENGRRLARIEGFLGIGVPTAAANDAPGASLAPEPSTSHPPPGSVATPSASAERQPPAVQG